MLKKIESEIAVRIDDTDTFTGFDILKDEIPQERSFPRARFSQHIHVLATVGRQKAESLDASPRLPRAHADNGLFFLLFHIPARHLLQQESVRPGLSVRAVGLLNVSIIDKKKTQAGGMRMVDEPPG
jgi:hypothetical protein